jgi:hypothetical protein
MQASKPRALPANTISEKYLGSARYMDIEGNSVTAREILGEPASAERDVPGMKDTRIRSYERGVIIWSPATGAHLVYGLILARYDQEGGAPGPLGLPTSDEMSSPEGRVSHFQHGSIYYRDGTDETRVERHSSDKSPAAAPASHVIISADEFNDPRSGWPIGLRAEERHGYETGVYFIEARANGWWYWTSGATVTDGNTLQVVGRVRGGMRGKPASWYVVCETKDPGQAKDGRARGFQVYINAEGELFLSPPSPTENRFPNDPRIGPIVHTAIRPGTEFNTVELRLQKRRVELFVNGVRVCDPVTFDWDVTPAKFSLGGGGGESRSRAEFGRFEIRSLTLPESRPAQRGPNDTELMLKMAGAPDQVSTPTYPVKALWDSVWRMSGNELVVRRTASHSMAELTGPIDLNTFTVEAEVRREEGGGNVELHFGQRRYVTFGFDVINGRSNSFVRNYDDGKFVSGRDSLLAAPIDKNVWHLLRVEKDDGKIAYYIDHKKVFESLDVIIAQGTLNVATVNANARFRNIRATSKDGKALLVGLPDLPKLEKP